MADLQPEEPFNSLEETDKGIFDVRIIQNNLLLNFSDGCIIHKDVYLFIYFMNAFW